MRGVSVGGGGGVDDRVMCFSAERAIMTLAGLDLFRRGAGRENNSALRRGVGGALRCLLTRAFGVAPPAF